MRHLAAALLLLLLVAPVASAQTPHAELPDVFLDCESWLCDFDYFRTEIPFVDYVRDRQDADVHVLVSTQATGAGGTAFTLTFLGERAFADLDDTLTYTSTPTATEDEIRQGLAQAIRAGLLRYVARTPLLDRMRLVYDAPTSTSAPSETVEDPWNAWVFTTRISGFANGESSYSYLNVYGSASASRTTDEWKTSLGVNASQQIQTFELADGESVESIQESYGATGLVVKSVSPHWSVGLRGSASRSTRLNYDLNAALAPAVEFNVFPYSESTRKVLAIQYALGPVYSDYAAPTIYDEVAELRLQHALGVGVRAKQPWGSVSVSTSVQQYLHDVEKFNLDLGGNIELRLFRGLSLDLGGNVEFVRAQLYLPKGDASDEDVLLRRRELATNWRYFANFGISYRFGSKFNNVVNPRFSSGGNVIYHF